MKVLLIINDPPYGAEWVYKARGLGDGEIMEQARRGSKDELAVANVEADKVLVF